MTEPNWDIYYCKHCARLYGWLPASKEYKEQNKKAAIKYFTLCATKAIDIFMFEMEGLLARDKKSGALPNVVICESDSQKAPEIFKVVRPPIKEAIIIGKLQDVLTFEEDAYTRTAQPNAFERDRRKRERLRLKQNFDRLSQYFPFDIVNFDPCESLLNPAISENKLYQALERIFELQNSTSEFLLFVTIPLFDLAAGSVAQLRSDYQNNVSKYQKMKEVLLSSLRTTDYDQIEENKKLALSIAKSVVIKAARGRGWDCRHRGIYIYENRDGHKILDSVVLCTKAKGEPSETSYVEDVVRVIREMPEYYSYAKSSFDDTVKEHLNKVVDFREKSRKQC